MKKYVFVEEEGTLIYKLLRHVVVRGRRYPFITLNGSIRTLAKKVKRKGFPEYYKLNPAS